MKSKEWLDRQNRDFYVKKAKKIGYVSRSAYKILEIEKKFKLINNSKNILELGSAPGGWSQVIFELKDTVKMYAFDLLDMKFKHPNMKFIKENFLTYDYSKIPHKFDLILSDIAPNTTGHQTTDHLRMSSIIEDIISVLDLIALPSSSFVFKIWKGSEEIDIINKLKKKYKKSIIF
jgi:23S rRNA (uridine2552-2'-O)-methyltransferase